MPPWSPKTILPRTCSARRISVPQSKQAEVFATSSIGSISCATDRSYSKTGQAGAFLPQTTRELSVKRYRVGTGQRLADNIASVEGGGVRDGREKKRCLGPPLGACHERFH